jgi:hypothetical protein
MTEPEPTVEKWIYPTVADDARKRQVRDKKDGRDLGTLDELSRMYVRLPAPQATALEVQIMARLRQVRAS